MTSPVWTFVPNLIGYSRIVLTIISFYYAFDRPDIFAGAYTLSMALDVADGWFARILNQSSLFGAVLDMVTDRASSAGLYAILTHIYMSDGRSWIFICLCGLDIISHYSHMYSTMLKGNKSHKSSEANSNILLKLYYTNRIILFSLCFGNEAYLGLEYLQAFDSGSWFPLPSILGEPNQRCRHLADLLFPFFLIKQLVSLLQLYYAWKDIVQVDDEMRAKESSKKK